MKIRSLIFLIVVALGLFPVVLLAAVNPSKTMERLEHAAELEIKARSEVGYTQINARIRCLKKSLIRSATLTEVGGGAVNIAGLEGTMRADTLFGHNKGAFSGADQIRKSLIATAIDEISDLSEASQVKLFLLIQEREYYALGSDVANSTNVRMIFATHRDLDSFQESVEFRKDLFFRLRIHHVHIPPLCERLDDLPLLLDYPLEEAAIHLN